MAGAFPQGSFLCRREEEGTRVLRLTRYFCRKSGVVSEIPSFVRGLGSSLTVLSHVGRVAAIVVGGAGPTRFRLNGESLCL